MQANAEKLEGSRVRLSVELDTDDLAREYACTVRRVGGSVTIKGFRRGKAPRRIVETYVGHDMLMRELIDDMVPRALHDAMRETGVRPIADPEFDLPDFPSLDRPFSFSAEMAVAPTAQLGDLTDLKMQPLAPEVTDAEVDEDISQTLRAESSWTSVERPAALGDRVDMELRISRPGAPQSEPQPYAVVLGENGFPSGFDEAVVSHAAGESLEFVADIPDDDPNVELRGQQVTFGMQLNGVNERKLPELTDEFARSLGGYSSVDDLRAGLRARRLDAKRHEEQHRLEEEALRGLSDRTTYDIPAVLIARESESLLKSRTDALVAQGVAVDTYLAMQGQTREDWEMESRQAAELRLRRGLALEAFAETREIPVEPAEIEAEIERVAAQYAQERRDAIRRQLDDRAGRLRLESGVRNRKALAKLLEEITEGAAPLHDHADEPAHESFEVADALAADVQPGQPAERAPSQDRPDEP